MVWTANELASKTKLTQQHVTRLFRKGRQMLEQNPDIHSCYDWIIGELKPAGWITSDEEGDLFIQAREEKDDIS